MEAGRPPGQRPLIGITTDIADRNGRETSLVTTAYASAVARAGGLPVLLCADTNLVDLYLDTLDGLVLTGGDDPRMEPFGAVTHPKATPLHPLRQAFESRLIERLQESRPAVPILGVCLGMQMLALHSGGTLDQHMPDTRLDAARHWDGDHEVLPTGAATSALLQLDRGMVRSRHKQAVSSPGSMTTLALSDDGVIEAIAAPERPFVLGVQWHPERTEDPRLGDRLFQALVAAAKST